jgi:hypothetical protein
LATGLPSECAIGKAAVMMHGQDAPLAQAWRSR